MKSVNLEYSVTKHSGLIILLNIIPESYCSELKISTFFVSFKLFLLILFAVKTKKKEHEHTHTVESPDLSHVCS